MYPRTKRGDRMTDLGPRPSEQPLTLSTQAETPEVAAAGAVSTPERSQGRGPSGWRKHPLTRIAEALFSAFFAALTALPIYGVVAGGHSIFWLFYAIFPAVACYVCIADAVHVSTRSPREEAEVSRRFESLARRTHSQPRS
jgi:hypothetical protein